MKVCNDNDQAVTHEQYGSTSPISSLLGLFSGAYLISREPNLQDVDLLSMVSTTLPPGWTSLLMV